MSVGSPHGRKGIADYLGSMHRNHKITRSLVAGILKDPRNAATVANALKKPSEDQLAALREKYTKIGGRSPLVRITLKQANMLHSRLKNIGIDAKVLVGMKHLRPSIDEAVAKAKNSPNPLLIGIVMFPTYSKVYGDEYEETFVSSLKKYGFGKNGVIVKSWDDNEKLSEAWQSAISKPYAKLRKLRTMVIFATHSLPKVFIDGGDPYIRNFESFAARIAKSLDLQDWSCAYYTGGHPAPVREITGFVRECKENGYDHVLIVPLGYVADNFETLYGLAAMCKEAASASRIGITLVKPLNGSAKLAEALSDIVVDKIQHARKLLSLR